MDKLQTITVSVERWNATCAEAAMLREALEGIYDADGELNPSNYDQDDVKACNAALADCICEAGAALATPGSDWLAKHDERISELQTTLAEVDANYREAIARAEKAEQERDALAAQLAHWKNVTGFDSPEEVVDNVDQRFEKELPSGLAKSLWALELKDNKQLRSDLARIKREAKAEALREAIERAKRNASIDGNLHLTIDELEVMEALTAEAENV